MQARSPKGVAAVKGSPAGGIVCSSTVIWCIPFLCGPGLGSYYSAGPPCFLQHSERAESRKRDVDQGPGPPCRDLHGDPECPRARPQASTGEDPDQDSQGP